VARRGRRIGSVPPECFASQHQSPTHADGEACSVGPGVLGSCCMRASLTSLMCGSTPVRPLCFAGQVSSVGEGQTGDVLPAGRVGGGGDLAGPVDVVMVSVGGEHGVDIRGAQTLGREGIQQVASVEAGHVRSCAEVAWQLRLSLSQSDSPTGSTYMQVRGRALVAQQLRLFARRHVRSRRSGAGIFPRTRGAARPTGSVS
jgi:hypothetical protein